MMKELCCVAVDDEPMALAVVSSFCKRAGYKEPFLFRDPDEAVAYIEGHHTDLIFLDIDLGIRNGVEVARKINKDICIIFTTAHKQYALDGFDIGIVDFLHKPFSYQRFEQAVRKAEARMEYLERGKESRFIMVKEEYMNVSIPLSDIIYVEAMDNYCRIVRERGVCTVSRIRLKDMVSSLPDRDFIRIHRSFVVAGNKVSKFTKKELILSDGRSITVGRQYADKVHKFFQGRSFIDLM